jgi:hypothetical protein
MCTSCGKKTGKTSSSYSSNHAATPSFMKTQRTTFGFGPYGNKTSSSVITGRVKPTIKSPSKKR